MILRLLKENLPNTIEDDVAKEFGLTNDFREVGYILIDGRLIDLSDKRNGGPRGKRNADHREITQVIEDDISGTEALIEFMHRGNIRVLPEYPAINLQIEPTPQQYKKIKSLIENLGYRNDYFMVEFDDYRGNEVSNMEYENNFTSDRIISDIEYYFREGRIPYKSDLARFRESLEDITC